MKINEIMTRDVISLSATSDLKQAAQLMKQFNVGSIPVVEKGKIIGIVTDRDIAIRAFGENKNVVVRDIMTSNPVTVDENIDVKEASDIMSQRQIRRLPVVSKDKSLVGIVSLGDFALEPSSREEAEEALSCISEPTSPEM